MSNKIKGVFWILVFGLACFVLGGYVYGTLNNNVVPKLHQWVLTSFFGLLYLILGIKTLTSDDD